MGGHGWLFAEVQWHVACCGQGCWDPQAALGCAYEHSALQRGLNMLWGRIIAMGAFSVWCDCPTGGVTDGKKPSFSLPLPWYLSCAAGMLGGL